MEETLKRIYTECLMLPMEGSMEKLTLDVVE
jgi:hypothetical protein